MPITQAPHFYDQYLNEHFLTVVIIAFVASYFITKIMKNVFGILEDRWEERVFWTSSFFVCTALAAYLMALT